MLIDTPEGVINTAQVVRVTTASGSAGHGTVTFTDGTSHPTTMPALFERACGVIVPAQPGYAMIEALLPAADEEGILYTDKPIIAFRVAAGNTGYFGPIPITVSGEPSDMPEGLWTVLQPDGSCHGPEGEHADREAFKAECERVALRRGAANG